MILDLDGGDHIVVLEDVARAGNCLLMSDAGSNRFCTFISALGTFDIRDIARTCLSIMEATQT